MADVRNGIFSIAVMVLAVFMSFRAMGAMQVHDNARVVISNRVCPSALNSEGACIVMGSLSRRFVSGEVEITLDDKSVLLLQQDDVHGYSAPANSTRYEPFGKAFAFGVGFVILLFGLFCIVGVPAIMGRGKSPAASNWPWN